jgi:hypothetical protein
MRNGKHINAAIRCDAIDHGLGKPLTQPAPSPARHRRSRVRATHYHGGDATHLRDKLLAQLREPRAVVPRRVPELFQRIGMERDGARGNAQRSVSLAAARCAARSASSSRKTATAGRPIPGSAISSASRRSSSTSHAAAIAAAESSDAAGSRLSSNRVAKSARAASGRRSTAAANCSRSRSTALSTQGEQGSLVTHRSGENWPCATWTPIG